MVHIVFGVVEPDPDLHGDAFPTPLEYVFHHVCQKKSLDTMTEIGPGNWPRSVRIARRTLEILRTLTVLLLRILSCTRTNTPNLALPK